MEDYFLKIFYIEDDNGEFMSINGKRRFTRLIGKKAMGFLNSKNGKRRFFLKTESNEYDVLNYFVDEIFIEVPSEKVSEIRSEKNHEDYLDKVKVTIVKANPFLRNIFVFHIYFLNLQRKTSFNEKN